MLKRLIAPFVDLLRRPSTDADLEAAERDIDDERLRLAGEAAVLEALRLWEQDIIDPKPGDLSGKAAQSRAVINECMRSAKGSGWSWEPPYLGDGPLQQWCGFFAARCWHQSIPLETRKTFFPSTARLDAWGQYKPWGDTPNPRPSTAPRLYARLDESTKEPPFLPGAGDIVLVGDGKPAYGEHVCMVERYDEVRRLCMTIEGNATGVGPRGNRREGIVKAERPIGKRAGHGYIVRRIIRPAAGDLTG